jgi:signal transduction histidine kinase
MALSIAMKQLQNKFFDVAETQKFIAQLPDPINQVGLLELYYYSGTKNPDYLSQLIQHIPIEDYLTRFRISIELTKHYAQVSKIDSFYIFQKQAQLMATYLADADADNHYNSTLVELLNQKLIPSNFNQSELVKTVYHWRTENRVGLYNYFNNQRIQKVNGQYLKQLLLNKKLVLGLVTLVFILFIAVYYIYKSRLKIKQINFFRHQFVFALSHDLNATLSELEWFAQENPDQLPEALLIEHRLMLNDTLFWAKTANQQELIKKEDCSFSDLVHECVDQLQSLIRAKNITINWLGDEDAIITINKPAMQVAIRNVLLNAIKHNTQNGHINIDIKPQEVSITNSTINHHKQASNTGSYLINYFTAINHAKYTLHINNQTAYCRIGL